ncbi:DUF3800 domain-containing protein [Kaistia adipata]|uniref:DUF3800 domain-containing protein n=1 Tax=Kaistia adipata TaxID=166954 RepID=UPI00048AB174|nr:DUF3800 domain-containing protein [Kaistia adipata]
MLVFIDESGDPGFKLLKGSSPTFVVCLVAFRDLEQSVLTGQSIRQLAQELKVFPEFKFSDSRDYVRDAFFETVTRFDFCVRALVVQKERIYSEKLRTDKEMFYKFFVKSMLKFDDGLLKGARVILDGSGDRSFRNELSAYLRRHTEKGAIKKFVFADSRSDNLVQLADMCTGAIARSFREDRSDAQRWRKILSQKIEDVWDFK